MRYKSIRSLIGFFPPVISQKLRALLYPRRQAYLDNIPFTMKACTGGTLKSRTSEFHGYPFSIHGYYEWRLITCSIAIISKGQSIIEIGANIGTETVSFIDVVSGNGKVIAFEPFPKHIESLKNLRLLNRAKNLIIEPYALSDIQKTLKFAVPKDGHSSGAGHLLNDGNKDFGNSIFVDCKTLDSYNKNDIDVELIFMDAEGSELDIIRGGKKFIARHRPVIILESAPKLLSRFGYSVKNLVSEVEQLGYAIFRMGFLSLGSLTDKNINNKQNLICIPLEKNKLVIPINKKLAKVGLLPMVNWLNPLKINKKEI